MRLETRSWRHYGDHYYDYPAVILPIVNSNGLCLPSTFPVTCFTLSTFCASQTSLVWYLLFWIVPYVYISGQIWLCWISKANWNKISKPHLLSNVTPASQSSQFKRLHIHGNQIHHTSRRGKCSMLHHLTI